MEEPMSASTRNGGQLLDDRVPGTRAEPQVIQGQHVVPRLPCHPPLDGRARLMHNAGGRLAIPGTAMGLEAPHFALPGHERHPRVVLAMTLAVPHPDQRRPIADVGYGSAWLNHFPQHTFVEPLRQIRIKRRFIVLFIFNCF